MAQCRRCKDERLRVGQQPREIISLPPEVTQDSSFRRKGIPVKVCEDCDGGVLERALAGHKKRVGS